VVGLASSSKWVFAAYVVQRYNAPPPGVGGAVIVNGLSMRLGYTYTYTYMCDSNCLTVTTVGGCFTTSTNSLVNPQAAGHFFYNSGIAQAVAANPAPFESRGEDQRHDADGNKQLSQTWPALRLCCSHDVERSAGQRSRLRDVPAKNYHPNLSDIWLPEL
jgi:hypothetical protein